ncbi:hypothetical protein NE237_002787 [Protea cynaroides]|uniref:NB-ARC domain-containing protein n=1 Tax=Protea cynaroides TaxID=273540 RepID=A0A9Q0QRZ4_9MAGN|nr:hypothetical protein NE237_002787 [Protea cynaroides]
MAELILVHGVGEILKKVISMATPEIGLLWNIKDELEKLVHTLTAIQALLQDAEKQQEENREEDKSEIVSKLTTSDNQDIHLSVLPIVGMGGIGKTTLAKLVYNDDHVAKYFDERVWIHVSRDFDIKKVLTDITESVTNRPCQLSSIDVVQRNLKDQLTDKWFLLVSDDIWNDNSEQWDMLKTSLKIGARVSTIIATTRSGEVASMIGTLAMHPLKRLSEKECWSTLKNKAFGDGGAEETPNMVAIGKEIVKKCGGMKRMKSLGSELYHHDGDHGSIPLFPSLEELSLLQMASLEEWVEPQPQGSFPSFPRLEKIFVKDCPKLMTMPSQFPSLKLLRIERSNDILLQFVVEVPSLTKLYIIEVPELQFLPKGLLHYVQFSNPSSVEYW